MYVKEVRDEVENGSLFTISLEIEGLSYNALVDAGANISCISSRLRKELKFDWLISNQKVEFASGQGTTNECVEVRSMLNGNGEILKFYLIEDLNFDIILGTDFLRKFEAIIDYSRQEIVTKHGEIKINRDKEKQVKVLGENSFKLKSKGTMELEVESPRFGVIKEEDAKILCSTHLLEKGVNKVIVYNSSTRPVEILPQGVLGYVTSVELKLETEDLMQTECTTQSKQIRISNEFNNNRNLSKILDRYFSKIDQTKPIPEELIQYEFKFLDPNCAPIYVRNFKSNPIKEKLLVDKVSEFEKRGIKSTSDSNWNSPAMLVPKGNGKFRFVIAYNELNELFIKEITPPPLISEVLNSLEQAKIFSTIDLTDGYFQIALHPNSRLFTAFTVNKTKYEFKRLPQGVTKLPPTIRGTISKDETRTTPVCKDGEDHNDGYRNTAME